MIVHACQHTDAKKYGRNATGKQRFRCKLCGEAWLEEKPEPLGSMRISMKDACTVLNLLLEGMSIRAASRVTGVHYDTIGDLILTSGESCGHLMETKIRGVEMKQCQIDELWSFVGCKNKTAANNDYNEDRGDSWTVVALDRDTKLVVAHQVGLRDTTTIATLLQKVADNTVGRFQLSTDGLAAYKLNVPYMLRDRVDFGVIMKQYANTQQAGRYSPANIIGTKKAVRFGNPDEDMISTSHVERMNLTIRMNNRRFTRLTNAHSKSLKHHVAMQNIFFAWYNWCRKHSTIKKTPAMASGLAEKTWSMKQLLENAAESIFSATS